MNTAYIYIIGVVQVSLLLVAALAAIVALSIWLYRLWWKHRRGTLPRIDPMEQMMIHDGIPSAKPAEPADKGDLELFTKIDTAIRSERLYADVNLQRQDICDRFGIHYTTLVKLLQAHADGLAFPAYVNKIRLEEVCQLLRSEPDMSVNAIAIRTGFIPRNLRRVFARAKGITPQEYREGREPVKSL